MLVYTRKLDLAKSFNIIAINIIAINIITINTFAKITAINNSVTVIKSAYSALLNNYYYSRYPIKQIRYFITQD